MPNSTVGWIAQSVEQRTENPCVGGSIPPPATTSKIPNKINSFARISMIHKRRFILWKKYCLSGFCPVFSVLRYHGPHVTRSETCGPEQPGHLIAQAPYSAELTGAS